MRPDNSDMLYATQASGYTTDMTHEILEEDVRLPPRGLLKF